MSETIDWVEFSRRRRAQREAAQLAVEALRRVEARRGSSAESDAQARGEEAAQRRHDAQAEAEAIGARNLALALLKSWFPAEFGPAQQLAISTVLDARPTVSAAAIGSLYPELAQPQPPMSAFEHLCALVDQAIAGPPTDPLVWALAELAAFGDRVVDLERHGWGQPDSAADAEVLSCWTALCHGTPFLSAAAWRDHFEAPFVGVLRGACNDAELSDRRREEIVAETRDNLIFVLGRNRDCIEGWRDVAARTLELDERGPLFALVEALDRSMGREGWRRVGRCLAVRGEWGKTLSELWPKPASRAESCAEALTHAPPILEELAGVHLIRRLLARWGEGADHPRAAWCTVRANRSILRARLRAMICELPAERLFELALSAPGLAARTDRAVRRYALAWAWHQLRRRFPGTTENPVSVPCAQTTPVDELDADYDFSMLRRWVLLVVLRGRLAHLERWVDTGGTGDRDATWGRLLSEELPEAIGDRRSVSPHAQLRLALSLALSEQLMELVPTLQRLVALPDNRGLPDAFNAVIAPYWHEELPKLQRGFARMQAHARAALACKPLSEEDRWTR